MSSKSDTSPDSTSSPPEIEAAAVELMFKQPLTFGEILKQCERSSFEASIASIPADKLSTEKRVLLLRRILRTYEPWPEWVLRVAAEIWHVNFPTIPKRTIEDSIRFLHFLVLEMKVDGSTPADAFKAPKVDASILGALIGHSVAQIGKIRNEFDEALAKRILTPEEHAKFAARASVDGMQTKLAPLLADYLKARPTAMLAVNSGLTKAKDNTFDKSGERKETTLTRIYEAMLRDWREIEELDGPTALCVFLSPVLKNTDSDPEKRRDRIKKICRRMGVTFKKPVKGQPHPPPLSLPPKS